MTGSNSVNVFLGLGMSWLIAAVYHAANGPTERWLKEVPADIQLLYRNGFFMWIASVSPWWPSSVSTCKRCGGELGGPYRSFMAAGFCVLWMIYDVMSAMKSYGRI